MAIKRLNPWDSQSKRLYETNGQYTTLMAYNGGGGRADGIIMKNEREASGFIPNQGSKAHGIGYVKGGVRP